MFNKIEKNKSLFKKFLSFFIKKINLKLKKKNYFIITRYGNASGEHICMTGIISKIYKENLKIIVFSKYPELFRNNPKIYKLYDLNIPLFFRVCRILNFFEGNVIKIYGSKIRSNDKNYFMKFLPRNIHLGLAHAFQFDMNLNSDDFKNEIYFTEKEIIKYEKKFNLPNQYAVIHSETKKTFIKTKEWGPEKIQDIVNKFDKINWIQVGIKGEFELKNTLNCYFNISLRELAFIISKSYFLVCMEGMHNHMASAFNKKNFLIHTGFSTMESVKYPNNILIENNSKLKCYPCFSFDCMEHKKHCDENLTSDYAINIIKANLNS